MQNLELREYKALFDSMHPGFFDRQYIKDRDEDEIYEEMILPLEGFRDSELDYPDGIVYGLYTGSIEDLRGIVREVVEGWPPLFNEGDRIYCGFSGDEIASFCLIEDMGIHELDGKMLKIGGPGCVGTVPKYRRQGIGLKMVQDVTRILKDEGYDISYIHYTGVSHWYAKLGYLSILKWNRHGIIDM